MSAKTQSTIQLVKLRSWYVPADAEAYNLLKQVGLPLVRIHKDLIPILRLACKSHKIRAHVTPFADILNEKLEAVGVRWLSREERSCKIVDGKAVFNAPLTEQNKKLVNRINEFFTTFFSRWGYSYNPTYVADETRKKLKFNVDFWFNSKLDPVIPIAEIVPHVEYSIVLGFTKLVFTFHNQISDSESKPWIKVPVDTIDVYAETGPTWTKVHTGTFKTQTAKQVSQLALVLGRLTNDKAALREW